MNIGDKFVYTKTLVPYTIKCIFNGIGVNEHASKKSFNKCKNYLEIINKI